MNNKCDILKVKQVKHWAGLGGHWNADEKSMKLFSFFFFGGGGGGVMGGWGGEEGWSVGVCVCGGGGAEWAGGVKRNVRRKSVSPPEVAAKWQQVE